MMVSVCNHECSEKGVRTAKLHWAICFSSSLFIFPFAKNQRWKTILDLSSMFLSAFSFSLRAGVLCRFSLSRQLDAAHVHLTRENKKKIVPARQIPNRDLQWADQAWAMRSIIRGNVCGRFLENFRSSMPETSLVRQSASQPASQTELPGPADSR